MEAQLLRSISYLWESCTSSDTADLFPHYHFIDVASESAAFQVTELKPMLSILKTLSPSLSLLYSFSP